MIASLCLRFHQVSHHPKDKSRKDAEKKSGISPFLKTKALFSETSKKELDNKKLKAAKLEKEYSQSYTKRIQSEEEQFYQRQSDKNYAINQRRQKLAEHDPEEVLKYFL